MKMPATTVVRGAPACTHWFRRRQETWVGIAPSRWLPLAFVVLATAAGAQTEQLLHSFRTFDSGSSPSYNGYPLVLPNGHVVGTALYGSSAVGEGNGVVFQLVPPTKTDPNWAYHVIHRFAGGADGAVPYGGLTLGANGILYGMTSEGGAANCGVVYQMTPPAQSPTGTWEEVVLYSFQASNPADGCYPWNTQLLYDSSTGSLYGTTSGGGLYNESGYMGIIFRLDPPAEAGGSSGRRPSCIHSRATPMVHGRRERWRGIPRESYTAQTRQVWCGRTTRRLAPCPRFTLSRAVRTVLCPTAGSSALFPTATSLSIIICSVRPSRAAAVRTASSFNQAAAPYLPSICRSMRGRLRRIPSCMPSMERMATTRRLVLPGSARPHGVRRAAAQLMQELPNVARLITTGLSSKFKCPGRRTIH